MKNNKIIEVVIVILLSIISFGANAYFLHQQWEALIKAENVSFILSSIIYLLLLLATIYNLYKYFAYNVEDVYKILDKNEKEEDINYKKNLLQNLFDHNKSKIQTLNSISKVSIIVGFLGTLIGLVYGLSTIRTSLNTVNTNDLLVVLNKTLSGLFIAFNTSIGGIITNIALTYSYSRKNKQIIAEYLTYEKEIIKKENEIIVNKKKESDIRWKMWAQKFELNEEKTESIKKDILNLSQPLTEAVGKLSNNIVSTLDDKFRESINSFISAVDKMPEKITNMLTHMIGTVQMKFDKILEELKEQTTRTEEEMKKQMDILKEVNDKYEEKLREGVEKRVNEIKDTLIKSLNEIYVKYDKQMEIIESAIKNLNKGVNDMINNVNNYPKMIKEEIAKYNNEIATKEKEILNKIEIKIGQEVAEKLIKPTREQTKEIIDIYKKEIAETISQIKSLSENIGSLSKELGDKSQKLPEIFENLGENLKKWQGNLKDYSDKIDANNNNIKIMNEKMKKSEESLVEIREALNESSKFLESICKSINELAEVVDFKGSNEKKNN